MAGVGVKLDPYGENNLILNPGFEAGVENWTLSAPSWASSSITAAAASYEGSTGVQAGRIQATKDATSTARTLSLQTVLGDVSVVGGLEYRAAVALNVADAPAGQYRLLVLWYDASGASISNTSSAGSNATGTKTITLNAVAPAGAVLATVALVVESAASGDTVDMYLDTVQFGPAAGQLDLADGTKFKLMKVSCPTPDRDVNWASSADVEGGLPANLRYQNRTLSIVARVYGSSASDLQTQLGYLEQKIGKINSERGTLEYLSASGQTCIFDLLEGAADYEIDNPALATFRAEVTITFTAKPFWRSGTAAETSSTVHKEETLPCVIATDTVPAGDVPALGKLTMTDLQGKDQWSALWAVQSRYYDPSNDAALYYEAETRTPQGGAATAALAGASGGGNNTVLHSSLITSYQSILSTQASGGGNHLKHVGVYRVFVRAHRPTTNGGKVSVCLEWAQGDFKVPTQNLSNAKTWNADELEGVFTFTDLGLVRLDKVVGGAQRWEGRILAKSTVPGDDIYIDGIYLFPVDEGYGALKITPATTVPTAVSAHDEFEQSEGNLDTPKALPVGGSWSEASKTGASGFKVISASKVARRSAISDADLNSGSYAIAGTTNYAATQVQVDVTLSSNISLSQRQGVFARYTDPEHWLMAVFATYEATQPLLVVLKRNGAGAPTVLAESPHWVSIGLKYTIALSVTAAGVWQAFAYPIGTTTPIAALSGQDNAFATGEGVLAEGKPGMYDAWTSSFAFNRDFDNFLVFAAANTDAAVFASRSAEVRAHRFQRQDSTGALWVPRPDYKGSYFKPIPARREGRPIRTIVKLSRGNVDTMADSAIDDASFKVGWQARGLVLPES